MRRIKIDWKYFWLFVLGFFLATIIGTQTHEFGHIAVAESLGYETTLSYGSMTHNHKGFHNDKDVIAWRSIFENLPSDENPTEAQAIAAAELYKKIKEKYPRNKKHSFYITLGGPAQTILTCFIGLFILAYRSNSRQENFKFLDWLAIFMALFILRELFNTVMAIGSYLLQGTEYFGGDEFRISKHLGFNQWTIPMMTAILGAIISSFVIFMIVPKRHRIAFILAGFVGSITGFILWFYYVGPWIFNS